VFVSYIDEKLKAYFEISSQDRRKILNEKYFDTNPLTCLKEYLPYLALEANVDIDNLSEEEARIAIDEAIKSLNYAGTSKRVKASVKPFSDAENKEWWEYNGEPYHFKAVLTPNRLDFSFGDRNYKKLEGIINKNKNVRSVFDGFLFEIKSKSEIKEHCALNIKSNLKKDYKFYQNNGFNVFVRDGINIKTDIKKDYTYNKKAIIKYYEYTNTNTKINLQKTYKYKNQNEAVFKEYSLSVFNSKLNSNEIAMSLNDNFNLSAQGVNNVYLNTQSTLNLTTKIYLQGAVVWLV